MNGVSEQSIKTLSSTSNSDASSDLSVRHASIETRVCLVGNVASNERLKSMLKNVKQMELLVVQIFKQSVGKPKYKHSIINMDLKIPYLVSTDGKEYEDEDPQYETIFILQDFESDNFKRLKKTDNRILGPPVISTIAATKEPLPYTSRPLYCTCMQGLNLCFTNFKTKEHLAHLVTLCHYMGACIRKDMSSKIDFLVTNTLHGPKYRTAVSLGTPVMKEEWIHRCWASKDQETPYRATDEEFLSPCKSKPFEGCTLSFLGFSEQEKAHMQEQAKQQGGNVAEVGDGSCTHLVVEESSVDSLPFEPTGKLYILVQEWFWGSIQIEAKAAESMYLFQKVEYPKMLTRSSTTSSLLGTPKWRGSTTALASKSRGSSGKHSFSRKRSRLREETLAKLAQDSDDGGRLPPRKRPSTDTSACIPDSMLDMSNNTTAASVMSPQTPDNVYRDATGYFMRLRSGLTVKKSARTRKKQHEGRRRQSICETEDNQNRRHLNSPLPGTQRVIRKLSIDESSFDSPETVRLRRKRKSQEWPHAKGTLSPIFKTPVGIPPCKKSSNKKTATSERPQCNIKRRKTLRRLSLLVTGQKSSLPQSSAENSLSEIDEESLNKSFSSSVAELEISDNDRDDALKEKVASPKAKQPAPVSARYQVVMELLQTEKNYVGILQTILNLFKKPLDDPNQPGGPILAGEDMKAIFSSLPDIEFVHRSMSGDLDLIAKQWNELSCVGDLVLKYTEDFGKCYPPFVNFFEVSVETITRCESRSSRFHAFLKINQAKRECGRQTLAELLINPVQRVPRIILLLQDLKKHTERENPSHPDVQNIQASIDALKVVMTHINEDKRKTESQRQIFDIVYEVDGCPPTIVSSHRQFVARAEMLAVDDNLCSKGDHISLFIFSDCVEIAKRRRGVKGNSLKSPNVHTRPPTSSSVRCLKHIKLMSLSHIKKVVNINDSEDCQNAVALYCRTPTDSQDWLYTFKVLFCSGDTSQSAKEDQNSNKENNQQADDNGKSLLLKLLAKHRANTVCKAVDENFVCTVNPHELDVCTADLGSTLGRAVRAAKKSSRKLTRAFSFSRTPRRVVQRAVTMLSPSQQLPPTGLSRADSITSRDLMDTEDDQNEGTSSGLTPSMSVTSLCTPQRDRRGNRLPSTSSLQYDELENVPPPSYRNTNLKPSVSTLTLARAPSAADRHDFPAVPTPPTRRRKVGTAIKAATVAFGRSGSFRRRVKVETML